MAAEQADNIDYDRDVLLDLSIADRYEDDMSIIHVFEELNLNDAERYRLINDGMTSVHSLVDQYGYDVKSLITYLQTLNKTFATSNDVATRVYFSPPVIAQFAGLLFYFNHCVNTFHIVPDILQVDGSFMHDNYDQWKEMTKDKSDDDEGDADVKLITLKGHENWIKWRDSFISNIANANGVRGIPLDYLLDKTPREVTHGNANLLEFETVNLEDENIFLTKAVHFGNSFKQDSKRLWKRLKKELLNTPPYNHISHHDTNKDGFGAWRSLLVVYEGSDFAERLRDTAFASMAKAHYNGETRNYGWEKYVNTHVAAHKQLIDAGFNGGKGMDDETKIQYLKQGIRASAGIEHALTIARSNNKYRYDFDLFVSFISGEVNARTDRTKQLKDASLRVSATRQGDRRTNHGGKGGNQQQFNANTPDSVRWKDRPSRVVDGKTVYGAKYPPNRFKKFTANQRKAVIELKNQYFQSLKSNSSGKNMVAALTAVQDDMTALESRIIKAVTRASGESNEVGDDEVSRVTDNDTTVSGGKRAPSGSIGSFLASQKKHKTNN